MLRRKGCFFGAWIPFGPGGYMVWGHGELHNSEGQYIYFNARAFVLCYMGSIEVMAYQNFSKKGFCQDATGTRRADICIMLDENLAIQNKLFNYL